MNQKEIYLIRHGETDFNLKKIVQGRGVNTSLNATGQQQAEAFFNYYKNIDFDAVYHSALQRTKQTVQNFIDLGIPTFEEESLDEINWGIYEGIEHQPEMHERYLSIIEMWRQGDLAIKIDGGESAQDLWDRQKPFVEWVKTASFNKILVCSHGRSIRALLCAMTKTPLELMDDFSHSNTCLYKLVHENDEFKIVSFNNIDHLENVL
jgi:broad specificity phosphatase PhoE